MKNIQQLLSSAKKVNYIHILTLIIIILGIIIRTKLLILNPSYWLDTYALALNINNSYLEFFKPLSNFQVAPPFFLLVSKFLYNFVSFNENIEIRDFTLRLFPYLCGVISLPLFSILIHKMFKNNLCTLLGTYILCFNIQSVYYTIEFKQYSCELLFSILLLYIFYSIDIKNISIKKLCLFSFIFTIAPWFSFSSWIILLVGLFYLVIQFKKTGIKNWGKLLVIFLPFVFNIIIFYIKFYLPVHQELYSYMYKYWSIKKPSFLTFENFNILFPQKLENLLPIFMGVNVFLFLGLNILFLFFSENKKNIYYVLSPILITIFMSFCKYYPFENRLILFLLPFFIILYIQFVLFITFFKRKIVKFFFSILIIFLSITAYNIPIDSYIVYNSNTRALFYELKQNNPQLINVITPNLEFRYQSNKNDFIYIPDNTYSSFEISKIPDYLTDKQEGIYWIYALSGREIYFEGLQKYLNNMYETHKFKELTIYLPSASSKNVMDIEKNAFIAKIVF